MEHTAAPARAWGNARPWRVLAVVLAVLAVATVATGWALRHDTNGPSSTTSAPADDPTGLATGPTGPAAHPTGIRIRSIDVDATVRPMGLRPDQTVEVPENPDNVGWYSLGSRPGQAGSAVLLGHVDSIHGPAVFAALRTLSPGALVDVGSSDGSTTRFEVTRSATYPNDRFPARKVYRTTGRPRITLVTCGGSYDASRGGYQANVVVYASLVGTTRSAPSS